MHGANLQSIIIRPFQIALVAFNQDWSRDILMQASFIRTTAAAPHCLLIPSSVSFTIYADAGMCACVLCISVHLASRCFCQLGHLLNYAAGIFGRANKWFTENSRTVSESPSQLSRRVNPRERIVQRRPIQRDSICITSCDTRLRLRVLKICD